MLALWAGIAFKLEEAGFFRGKMSQTLMPVRARRDQSPYYHYMNTVVVHQWAPDFYYHFDAFLASARSVDFVISASFGWENKLKSWINKLPPAERKNRKKFNLKYQKLADKFRKHHLTHVRDLSIHRAGTPSVKVTLNGRWGMVYSGGPTRGLPTMEQRPLVVADDPGFPVGWMQSPDLPLEPREDDFSVTETLRDGTTKNHKFFVACDEYLALAQTLRDDAMALANEVYQGQAVTPPPLYKL